MSKKQLHFSISIIQKGHQDTEQHFLCDVCSLQFVTNMSETINPPVDQSNGKFKWQGDIDLYKEFVEDLLNITGRWTSPRGGCKQIKTANITLRLYENRSILLEGLWLMKIERF